MKNKYSIIIPLYCSEENIPALLEALEQMYKALRLELEIIFVDDASPDQGAQLLQKLMREKYTFPCELIFHSRNFGSYSAIRSGMKLAKGKYIACMSADMQEPPELMMKAYEILETQEFDIVLGARNSRKDPWLSKIFSKIYWIFYKKFIIPELPIGGVDGFIFTNQVRDIILNLSEQNTSMIAQFFWVGFRRKLLFYDRQERAVGKSAWTMNKKIRYFMDSIFSITDLPLRVMLVVGAIGLFFSVLLGLGVFWAKLSGLAEVPGYATTILSVLIMGSILIASQAIMGMYMWRCLENTKARPLSIVSQRKSFHINDEVV